MEKATVRNKWLNGFSLLLVLPTLYFIAISVLKYAFGVNGPFDSAEPFLQNLGIQEPLGWNINLLILFGPLLAFGIAAWQVLHIKWHFSKEQFDFNFRIDRKWFPIVIALVSALLLGALFVYLVGENVI